jgi:hypothetical protein
LHFPILYLQVISDHLRVSDNIVSRQLHFVKSPQ